MLDHLPYVIIGAALVLTSRPLVFVLFLAANAMLNKLLKRSIQQPRPRDCASYLKKSYGMPSGHSQNASFATAFVWTEATYVQKVVLALAVLATLVQRVVTRCHNIAQVLSGLAVGLTFGLLAFHLSKKIIDSHSLMNTR
jgi:membrane-associated phospholipid phosphatase